MANVKGKKKEEVVVEKRFCPDCGKELPENEVCNCKETHEEVVSINVDKITKAFKNIWNIIINWFKKPYKTVMDEAEKENTKTNMFIIILLVISASLCFVASISSFLSSIYDVRNFIEIPYFKFFVYALVFEFILVFVPISATYIIAKITGSKNYSYKKSIALYVNSMVPMILANLFMALLYLLHIIPVVGLLVNLIIGIIAFFNYIFVYLDLTKIKNDIKSYATCGLIIINILLTIIVLSIFTSSIRESIGTKINNGLNNNYNFNDLFE